MTAGDLASKILIENQVHDKNGKIIILDSNIDANEGEFIREIIVKNNYEKSIEIGCAYGISSLYICDAIKESKTPSHTIIDPFQHTDWKGIGIENLKRSGIEFYNHINKASEIALPELLNSNESFDFAFIDGWHTFDHTLLDLFYLSKMLEVGGSIIIDDVGMQSIRKLMRYVIKYPAFEVTGGVILPESRKRNLFNNFIIKPLRFFAKLLPQSIRNEIYSPEFLISDKNLNLNVSMIALKKVAEDNRPWNWFEKF